MTSVVAIALDGTIIGYRVEVCASSALTLEQRPAISLPETDAQATSEPQSKVWPKRSAICVRLGTY
jgi:hypothetical protein